MTEPTPPLLRAVRLAIAVGATMVLLRHASYWSAAWQGELTASPTPLRLGVLAIDVLGLLLMLAGAIAGTRRPLHIGGLLALVAVVTLAALNAADASDQPLRAAWQAFTQLQLAAIPLLAILAKNGVSPHFRKTAFSPAPGPILKNGD